MSSKRPRTNSQYRPLHHVIPTSNCCERLFSQCKLVYSDHRRRMLPVNLEVVMYLKLNAHLWDALTVEECRVRVEHENQGFLYANNI